MSLVAVFFVEHIAIWDKQDPLTSPRLVKQLT